MFDQTHQYGDYVVISADGPHDVMGQAVREQGEKALLENAHNVVPEPYRFRIEIIEMGPTWIEDPFGPPGNGAWAFTLAWKYKPPPKEASVRELAKTLQECSDG